MTIVLAIVEKVDTSAQDAPGRNKKLETHKTIAACTETPVMILDVDSKKSYKECKEYILNGQDFSSSHISLIESATSAGYDVVLMCQYQGKEYYIHLEDWIETLELNYNLTNYTYEEILRTGFTNWVTGFEM